MEPNSNLIPNTTDISWKKFSNRIESNQIEN